MIDHVPIHIRITERWKIDPKYTDARSFWRDEERHAAIMGQPGLQKYDRRPSDLAMQHCANGGDYKAIRVLSGLTRDQMAWYVQQFKRFGTVKERPVKMEYMTDAEIARDEYVD